MPGERAARPHGALTPPRAVTDLATAIVRTTLGPVQAVIDVELERDRELRIEFDDGVAATFPLLQLRRACPCAACQGRREHAGDVYAGSTISVTHAELHGNWGIAIRWSDGHDTGIYAWEHLRRWWDAGLD